MPSIDYTMYEWTASPTRPPGPLVLLLTTYCTCVKMLQGWLPQHASPISDSVRSGRSPDGKAGVWT